MSYSERDIIHCAPSTEWTYTATATGTTTITLPQNPHVGQLCVGTNGYTTTSLIYDGQEWVTVGIIKPMKKIITIDLPDELFTFTD